MPPIGNKLKQEENRKLLANPKVQAMLNTIAFAEGADYNTRVGGGTFNDLSKKPGKSTYIKSIGTNSTAEGRYQFLNKTWDAVAKDLGLPDFSPQSQDLAAIELIKRRGALGDVLAGNLTEAIPKLSKEWASLPTKSGKSAYGQRARSFESLRNVYEGGAGGSSYVGTGNSYEPIPRVYMPQNSGSSGSAVGGLEDEEDVETKAEVEAKETIDKISTEQQMIQDYFTQNQQTEAPQQQQQVAQAEATPEILDQYNQVSQFVDTPVSQQGGFIKDNRGQWKYPGQKTEIASPHITMQGVDYPVLGISKETGEQKIMMPNQNYFFEDTQNVLEIPQLKNYFNKR